MAQKASDSQEKVYSPSFCYHNSLYYSILYLTPTPVRRGGGVFPTTSFGDLLG